MDDDMWEKLDKPFCNESWFSLYLDYRIKCLLVIASNHSLMLVNTFKKQNYKRQNFHYQNMWSNNPSYNEVVEHAW